MVGEPGRSGRLAGNAAMVPVVRQTPAARDIGAPSLRGGRLAPALPRLFTTLRDRSVGVRRDHLSGWPAIVPACHETRHACRLRVFCQRRPSADVRDVSVSRPYPYWQPSRAWGDTWARAVP